MLKSLARQVHRRRANRFGQRIEQSSMTSRLRCHHAALCLEQDLAPGDQLIAFSEGPDDSVKIALDVLALGEFTGAREALASLLGQIKSSDTGDELFDVTAALVFRTEPAMSSVKSTAEAIAEAAAAYEALQGSDTGAAD